jgi:hypothetical protein
MLHRLLSIVYRRNSTRKLPMEDINRRDQRPGPNVTSLQEPEAHSSVTANAPRRMLVAVETWR